MVVIILFLVTFYIATFLLDLGTAADDIIPFFWTPKDVYNSTHMNWLGVFLVIILTILIEPIGSIVRFVYWLCHLGRDD